MKNRQFIVLCCLIVIGFCVLYIQNKKYNTELEWYFAWSITMLQDKIDSSSEWILKAIYWLD